MKKLIVLPTLVAVSTALTGCGWLFGDNGMFRDRGDDYRNVQVEQPIAIPPGLTQVESDEGFAIPPIAYSSSLDGRFVIPRPEPLDGNPEAEQVKIQTLDSDSWILVEATPGEVWPRLRQFLNTNQLGVARADATAGLIETAWLQPKTEGTQRERYRFRIEQGVQRGSSEVYVLQSSISGEKWPEHSSNRAREDEMVKALAQFIADNGSTGAVSMLAQRGESPFLRLELPFERAWASLTTALPKAGFTTDDLNRSESELWVRYTPPRDEGEEAPGLWSRFWDWVWSSDEEAEVSDKIVYVLRMQAEPGNRDAVRIDLQRQDGQTLSTAAEEELLNRIKNKLS